MSNCIKPLQVAVLLNIHRNGLYPQPLFTQYQAHFLQSLPPPFEHPLKTNADLEASCITEFELFLKITSSTFVQHPCCHTLHTMHR